MEHLPHIFITFRIRLEIIYFVKNFMWTPRSKHCVKLCFKVFWSRNTVELKNLWKLVVTLWLSVIKRFFSSLPLNMFRRWRSNFRFYFFEFEMSGITHSQTNRTFRAYIDSLKFIFRPKLGNYYLTQVLFFSDFEPPSHHSIIHLSYQIYKIIAIKK